MNIPEPVSPQTPEPSAALQPAAVRPPRRVPLGVAIAGLILVLLVAGIVLSNIIDPLAELVFGVNTDVPVPDGAKLEKTTEHESSSKTSKEWLYSTNQTGCEVAKFYVDQGAQCRFSPFVCDSNYEQRNFAVGTFSVAMCSKTQKGEIAGYSWDVYISSGFTDGPQTRFQIALYK